MSQHLRALLLLCSAFFCSQAFATTYVPIQVGDITVIIPIDDPPVAQADSFSLHEDTPTTLDVLANDTDEKMDTIVVNVVQSTSNGTLVHGSDNKTLTYTPAANFYGVDSFSYNLTDEKQKTSETVTVTIQISPVNDIPVADPLTVETDEDNALEITPAGSDAETASLLFRAITQPQHGSVQFINNAFVYTPDANFFGPDSFTYVANDGAIDSTPAQAAINVLPVNDAPIGVPENIYLDERGFVEIDVTANDIDYDGDNLKVLHVIPGNNKIVASIQDKTGEAKIIVIRATENDYRNSNIVLSYDLTDGTSIVSNIKSTVIVNDINEPPVISVPPSPLLVAEDDTLTVPISSLGEDSDGDPLIVTSATASNGTLLITEDGLSYKPRANYAGSDQINFTVFDGEFSASGSVNVTINSINDAPVAYPDEVVIEENQTIEINALNNDVDADGEGLTIVAASIQAQQGHAELVGNLIRYTPPQEFFGTDIISYQIVDGSGATASSTIVVLVTDVLNPPEPQNDLAIIAEDTTLTFTTALINDFDPDGDTLSISGVTASAGYVTNTENTIVYTPASDFHGEVTLTYTVSDGTLTAEADIVVTVTSVNDDPVVLADSAFAMENETTNIVVLGNDYDPDGDSLSLVPDSLTAQSGNVSAGANNTINYTPTLGFSGNDSISYTVIDGEGGQASGTVAVTVSDINNPPVAVNDLANTNEDTELTISDALANDTDLDGDTLNITEATVPAFAGSVILNGSVITYTPTADFNGTANISYTISDVGGLTDSATIVVTVNPVNDLPVIDSSVAMPPAVMVGNAFSYQINASDTEDTSLSYSLSANAPDWLSVNTEGLISGTPGPSDAGTTSGVTYSVTDSDSGSQESAPFDVVVQQLEDPDWAETGGTAGANGEDDATATASTFKGAIPGEAGVSGGGAVYNIPVVIPPGRNGVQPDVSLNFSSRSGMGIAGVGWNLSAGSSISRCPRTAAQDGVNGGINYDSNDRLCLDGQRLVPVSGAYGAASTVYTTEMESFIRVIQNGALTSKDVSFTAVLPDGGTRTYGHEPASRVYATAAATNLEFDTPMSWLVDKYTDVTGNNTMTYYYTNDKSHGEVLLDKITYTGDASNEGNREVSFTYQDSEKHTTSFNVGGKTASTKRLWHIETRYANSLVRSYVLDYALSTASGRPLLRSVTECGHEGTSELCREPTTFDWADDAPVYKLVEVTDNQNEVLPTRNQPAKDVYGNTVDLVAPAYFDQVRLTHDFDGNGVVDLSYEYNNKTTYFNAEGESHTRATPMSVQCEYNRWTFQDECITGDFNVDGITDSFGFVDGQLFLYVLPRPVGPSIANDTVEPMTIATNVRAPNGESIQLKTIQDFNGDGYPDIVVARGDYSTIKVHIVYHTKNDLAPYGSSGFNLSNDTPVFTVERTPGVDTFNKDVRFVGDMNADGLADYIVTDLGVKKIRQHMQHLYISSQGTNGIAYTQHDINFTDGYNGLKREQLQFDSLIDANGDGLQDWFGYLFDVENITGMAVKLNHGDGTFGPAKALPNIITHFKEQPVNLPSLDSGGQEDSQGTQLTFESSFRQMDIDGDGTTELLMPGQIYLQGCTTRNQYQGRATFCGAQLEGLEYINYHPRNYKTPIPVEANSNVYKFKAVKFSVAADGGVSADIVEDTGMIGSAYRSKIIDMFGKGLPDMLFAYGCEKYDCSIDDSNAEDVLKQGLNSYFVNRNFGSGSTDNPEDYIPIDTLSSVTNGVGMVSRWDYSPLSSDEFSRNGPNQGDFYDPIRETFEDNEHFNFASSMYVVASFKQSNGIGGDNETRYQYAGAVYNTKGRGFRGFKSITERDITNGTTATTQFWQKFPYSSAAYTQATLAGASADHTCIGYVFEVGDDIYNSAASVSKTVPDGDCPILSQSLNLFDENPSYNSSFGHYSENSAAIYQSRSEQFTYDPTSHKQLSKTVSQTNSVDGFGNVGSRTVSIEDDYGTYTTIETADYSEAGLDFEDAGSGEETVWPGKYKSKTVTKKSVNRTGKLGLELPAGRSLDNDKVVTTDVTWDKATRKPATVTVKYGDNSAGSTATITTTRYNSYGLPVAVGVKGNVREASSTSGNVSESTVSQTRLVFTTYTDDGTSPSSAGYFPLEIKQRVSGTSDTVNSTSQSNEYLIANTETQPRTGLPLKVTDVSGVVTDTTYDILARPETIKRSGKHTDDPDERIVFPTQYISYMKTGSGAPAHAIMQINTVQSGVPATAEYKDLLGRTLRSSTTHFDGVSQVKQDVEYNARGLVVRESQPYTSSPAWTVYEKSDDSSFGYDVLGRNKKKETPQTNGKLITTYDYNDYSTAINVRPTDGQILDMSRTYNSLEQLVQTTDAIGGVTQYAYDGSGNPVVIQDAAQHSIVAQYDALGRKNYVDDPNMGRTDFVYNDFGELESETASGSVIHYDMDPLGRVVERHATGEGTASFNWDTAKPGLLASQSGNGASTSYQYDDAARITHTTVSINDRDYVTSTIYDGNLGRPKAMQYPAVETGSERLTVAFEYNPTGYLTHEKNASSGFVYREVTGQDALGNITNAWLNDKTLQGDYDYHHITGQMLSTKAGAYHDISYKNGSNNGYDNYGNLTHQKNQYSGATETYSYDKLHRLIQSNVTYNGGNATIDYGYDAVGNILKKTDYSVDADDAYQYAEHTNQIDSIRLKDNGGTLYFGYDNRGNQTHRTEPGKSSEQEMWYNAFNKPTVIKKNSQDITLSYGADIMRFKQVRKVAGETITTWYIGKHFEVEERDSFTNYRHFISDVAIVDLYDTQVPQIAFTHKDRLGSTVTMTDGNNTLTSMRHFDAFGKPRGGDWALIDDNAPGGSILANAVLNHRTDIRRGFTDHEHLDEAELIHMNGRVYDYNVGRFMSVDPYIQEAWNSQSINPYSYILNNPLSGTDPSGYSRIHDDIKLSEGAGNFSDHTTPANPSTEDKNKWAVIGAGITNINRSGNDNGTQNTTNVVVEGQNSTTKINSQEQIAKTNSDNDPGEPVAIVTTPAERILEALDPNTMAGTLTSNGVISGDDGDIRAHTITANPAMALTTVELAAVLAAYRRLGPQGAQNMIKVIQQRKTLEIRKGSPGVVQSRINVSNSGFKHVVDGHFNIARIKNKSQFTITQGELRALLTSKSTVATPVKKLESGAFERVVTMDFKVGQMAEKFGGGSTNSFRVLTDRLGNLQTAHPVRL